MKKVEIQARKFRARFFDRLVNGLWFFIFLFGYGYIITSGFFFLILTLSIAAFNVWISYRESINCIHTTEFINGKILIYYFIKDLKFPAVELELRVLKLNVLVTALDSVLSQVHALCSEKVAKLSWCNILSVIGIRT